MKDFQHIYNNLLNMEEFFQHEYHPIFLNNKLKRKLIPVFWKTIQREYIYIF